MTAHDSVFWTQQGTYELKDSGPTYELTAAVTLSTRPTQDQDSRNPRTGVRGACKVVPLAEEPLAVAG